MKMSRLFRKTLIGAIILFGVIATATSILSGWNLYSRLTDEFRSKGAAIARSIADSSVETLLYRDPSTIQALLDQALEIRGVAYVFVVDAQNEIIAHTFVPAVPDEVLKISSGAQSVREGTAITDLRIEGMGDFINVSSPILAGVAGAVHVGMDRKIISDDIRSAVIRQQLLMLAIFLLSVIAAYIFVNRISRPLTKLAHYANRIAEHGFESAANSRSDIASLPVRSDDEVGKLAQSFIYMESTLRRYIGDLQRTTAELEEYSQKLEQKVEERTAELREKNVQLEQTLQQIKEMQNQIIMQEKMASLGGLTAGIAHEIKNPLNFVNNFAALSVDLTRELRDEIRNQKDKLDAGAIDYIEEILDDLELNVTKINEHGKRADSIVRGMLLHSRGKSGERQPTDINALLAEYVNLAYHGMRAQDSTFNVKIESDYDSSIGLVKIVPQDISRVFLNMVNNACYAANGKKQQVGDGFTPTITVRTRNLGDKVEIRIRDNGKGIPKEARDKIFNPFFTTKPTGKGTGLGLSISYDIIVQQHKGEIKIETEEGSYAEFIIILPKEPA